MSARRFFAFLCCAISFAGCGGAGSSGSAPATVAGTGTAITANFSFAVPARSTSASVRRATYISPSSQSLQILVAYGPATTVGALLNLSPLPAACSVVSGVTQCSVAVVAQASATGFIISFYDQANAQGNLLSTATVPVPPAVNGVANVAATLQPVAANITFAPATPLIQGQPTSTQLVFTVLDADGNAIPGTTPFSTPIQLLPASSAITFTPSTISSPGTTVTVSYSGAPVTNSQVVAQIGSTTITTQLPLTTATATPTPGPTPTPTPAATPVPSLVITPAEIGVTVGDPGVPITVTASGATGTVTLTDSCVDGAAITLSQTTAPPNAATAVTVTAVTAPSGQPAHACTVTGTAGTLSASALVDVNQNSTIIDSHARSTP